MLGAGMSFGQTNSIDSKVKQQIDSTYNAKIDKHRIVGASIAIVKDGKIVYANGYGFQNLEDSVKADENTIYRIGSCTKSFTALSIMQLQDQGKLTVSDPVQKHVQSLRITDQSGKENPILIKDVLSHQSGLPSDMMNGFFCDNPPTMDWTIDQLNKMVTAAPANYVHSYSNVGYGVLGKLIENVSGLGYEEYLVENVFNRLEMKSSFVSNGEAHVSQTSRGYLKKGESFEEPQIRDEAAGLIHSSVLDMANYLKMFLADGEYNGVSITKSTSIEAMESNALLDIELPTSNEWGYGLYAHDVWIKQGEDSIRTKVIGHGGDTWAFHADFKYIPELNVGAVILTNTKSGTRISDAEELLRLYLEETNEGGIERINEKNVHVDELCEVGEIVGQYFLGNMNMAVKNPKKIKIKMNAVSKLILKPVNDSLRYAAKVKLLGIIPIKVKHQEFSFVKKNDRIYFKVIRMGSGNEDYASRKFEKVPVSEEWKSSFGNYKLTGDFYTCEDCDFVNYKGLTIEITEEKGMLVAKMEGTSDDTKRTLFLEEISGTAAVTIGIGRGTGETLRILENGNLFYSGFELSKMD